MINLWSILIILDQLLGHFAPFFYIEWAENDQGIGLVLWSQHQP